MVKRGRKPKEYRTQSGDVIQGLSRRKDGRWYPTGRPDVHFGTVETPESEALRRFRAWQAKQAQDVIHIRETLAPMQEGDIVYIGDITPERRAEIMQAHSKPRTIYVAIQSDEFWRTVAELIRENPKLVSQKTGIPEIAYLWQIDKFDSTPLKDLGKLYQEDKKATLTPKELTNSGTWWGEFCKLTDCKAVAELNRQAIRHYRSEIERQQRDKRRSNDRTRSRFGKVKSIVNHALTEGDLSVQDRQALTLISLLKMPPKPTTNPQDLSPSQVASILKHADSFDTAMILTALNCAYGPKDIQRLRWEHIDNEKGTIVFDRTKAIHRTKSSIPRVAVLWTRTRKALDKIRNRHTHVFLSREGAPIGVDAVERRFRKLCDKAELPSTVLFKHLRSSAQTVAAQAGVAPQQYQTLSGHKFPGVDDNYIRRNPMMVADACNAIEAFYFGKSRKGKAK